MLITLKLNGDSGEQVGLGQATHILHERGFRHRWQGVGPLSIKCFFGGRAFYDVGVGRYAVDDSSYLILNEGQTYLVAVDSETEIESFCIFFEHGLAESIQRSLSAKTSQLLDDPVHPTRATNFFEKTYPHDEVLSPALLRLRTQTSCIKHETAGVAEQLHEVMERLLLVHAGVRRQVESIPALRATSREELYRRLHRARDYAAACFDEPITLNDMARVACLSTNHFLRTFKQAFHQTPHQYLTRIRLERAQGLLVQTDQPVTDVCFAVGFESLGSFSWLFRQRVGVPPETYRRAKR
ncbi:MAG: AraC family transcriptional regulator [Pyrinomonadaceae bacterium]|nr:AraC family transcriptional regulator [Pyrinomonadaceae bacterium]